MYSNELKIICDWPLSKKRNVYLADQCYTVAQN